MKTSSKKGKGRRLQNFVRDNLVMSFPSLEPDDIKAAIMGESGEDIKLSPAAKRLIPFSFECKNQERLNIWQSLQQAEDNCEDREPVLVFKRNRTKTYVAIEFTKFLEFIGSNNVKRTGNKTGKRNKIAKRPSKV
jgi:hypothetical protein|tara:strand:+ start:351 stop:755 length:405 start_codon:yes stop_codon:yes gene_type:complete